MVSTPLTTFLSGASMMGFFIAALFFTRFWTRTRDRLFLIFACAFAVLSMERWLLLFINESDFRPWVYLIRLFAFILIIIGIADKNRATKRA